MEGVLMSGNEIAQTERPEGIVSIRNPETPLARVAGWVGRGTEMINTGSRIDLTHNRDFRERRYWDGTGRADDMAILSGRAFHTFLEVDGQEWGDVWRPLVPGHFPQLLWETAEPVAIESTWGQIYNIPGDREVPAVVSLAIVESEAGALFARINELRAEASKPPLVRDEGLDRIALAYATQIFFDADARSDDFQTLPNGERVITLAHALGVPVSGFDYSVFLGFSIEAMEDTGEFIGKAVEGDFTGVGVVWVGEYGGYSSMVVIQAWWLSSTIEPKVG